MGRLSNLLKQNEHLDAMALSGLYVAIFVLLLGYVFWSMFGQAVSNRV